MTYGDVCFLKCPRKKHVLGAYCLISQWCMTLGDPMNCSLPYSSVHGILQARIWDGLPFSSSGVLPNPEFKLVSPALAGRSLPLNHQGSQLGA